LKTPKGLSEAATRQSNSKKRLKITKGLSEAVTRQSIVIRV
jgi:hypothetical protein